MNEATMTGQSVVLESKPQTKESVARNFTPKESNGKTVTTSTKSKTKKKPKKLRKLLIFFISFVILIGGAITALYFSGLLMPLMEYVGIIDEVPTEITLQEREKLLDKRDEELTAKEEELSKLEATLLDKQVALDLKENSASAAVPFEETLDDLSDSKLEEIKSVANIYSKMDPESAAAIMTKMRSNDEIALILYHMKPAAAALVLEKMDATLASTITKLMLG